MKDVRFNKFNEKLRGPEPLNWRNLRTPETSDVPSEYVTVLETPIKFSMVNGEISKVEVSSMEPQWSINMKKSLVSLMKVQTSTGEHDLSGNSVRAAGGPLPSFWKVMEQGVDGKCENTYQLTELPEYMLEEVTYGIVDTEKCQGKKIFQVLKSRDVNRCVERTSYQVNQPGRYLCQTGNCDSMWQRSSITRYIGCGSSSDNMELQLILNEGELQQNLLAYNVENVVTGTRQTLKIVETRTTISSLPEIESPRTLDDILYEHPQFIGLRDSTVFPERDHSNYAEQQRNRQKQQEQPEKQRYEPIDQENDLSKLSPEVLQQQIIQKLTEVARSLKEVDEDEKKQVSTQVLVISKVFSLLSTEHMSSLYDEINRLSIDREDRETMRQLVLEISVISGTNPAIMFMKELIESEKITPLRTGVTIALLPHYIRTPTVQVLNAIFELIKSPAVTKHGILKANAQLAFATIINKACIDSDKEDRFPEFVFGEFCNSQTSEITSSYIPYFVSQLHSASSVERDSNIIALGALGHESIVSVLLPYIEGKVQGTTALEQRMSIYSLSAVARKHRDVLLPVYSSIAHNPSEDRNVRIAALSMILRMNPSMAYMQKLATSTWFEKDTEFHKFVFSTIRNLKEIKIESLPNYGTLYDLSNKARIVYHLAKPLPSVISSTLNYFTAEWLKELQVGYEFHGAYTTLEDNYSFYGKIDYVLEQLKFAPIEFCVGMKGSGKLVEIFKRIFTQEQGTLDNIHPEWRNIISAINLKSAKDTPFIAGIWTKLFNDVQFTSGLDSHMLEPMLKSLKQSLSEPQQLRGKMCGRTPLNFVKLNDWSPSEVLIPSDMGLPILIEVHMPVLLSVQGELNVDCSAFLPSVELNILKKTSATLTGYVGTICPFTKEMISVGVNQHMSMNYPTKMSVKMEMGKLKMNFSPSKHQSSGKDVELYTYSVRPWASIKPVVFLDCTSFIAHKNTKIIKSEGERKSDEFSYGESLGLKMKYVISTETDIRDMKSLLNHLNLYKYNPVNMMMFSWTSTAIRMDGRPTCRYHDVKIVYSPIESTTTEIEIDIGMAFAYKQQGQALKQITLKSISDAQSPIQLQHQDLQLTSQQNQYIKNSIQKLQTDQAVGLSTVFEVKLKGGNEKTFSWHITVGHGHDSTQQKWNIHLEDKERMSLCVDGKASLPSFSWRDSERIQQENFKFSYENIIGFGQTCQEHRVKVTGTSSVSEQQKQRAQKDVPSRLCEEAIRMVDLLKEQIRHAKHTTEELHKLELELVHFVEQKIEFCKQHVEQLRTLDQVKFKVEYTPMPKYVERIARYVDGIIKTGLLPFMSGMEGTQTHNEIDVELKFNPHWNTVDMDLTTEMGTINYRNIRLPEKLRNVLPLVASESATEKLVSAVKGEPIYDTCVVRDQVIKSFDNKTYSYQLDDCYHVLFSDCSKDYTNAVLGKAVERNKFVKIFTKGSLIKLEPSSSYTESRKDYEITVDGQVVNLSQNEKREILSKDERISYRMQR